METAANVLIVDDDRKLCRLLTDYLTSMGYTVACAFNGPDGLARAAAEPFQAIILDVMMPGMDGFEVLKRLRTTVDTPVIMLTARGDETDRIVGLELGADDYLPKPFSTRELLARLKAVARRYRPAPPADRGEPLPAAVAIGDLRIAPEARAATLAGAPLNLTAVEFDILFALARAAGRVLSRDQLLDEIAGREYEIFDRSIDVHISALRRKLGDDPKTPRFIKTVRGTGYLFLRSTGEDG